MSQPLSDPPATEIIDERAESGRFRQPSSIPVRIFALCLTSVAMAVHYTNYGPLIPVLGKELHITAGQAGLMSTLLFLGLTATYIPAGVLVDRHGSRLVLIWATVVMLVGGVLLPLVPNLVWLLACRLLIGFGSGAAFVAGAGVAAGLEGYGAVGLGLYGGSIQIGSGLGLLATPLLYNWIGWRGAFLVWGLVSISAVVAWFYVSEGAEVHREAKVDVGAGVRSPAVWSLGLSHLGTFGLGNAIAAWISVYLVYQYGVSLQLAATFGALALLSGMLFRPLGGILLARKIIGAIPLLRVGTIMGFIGVVLLALPLRFAPVAAAGMALIAIGSTTPYSSVFNEAARLRTVRKGVAQAWVSIISIPTVLVGPPLIGLLFGLTGNFVLAFGSILIFSAIAVTASFVAGPAVKRETRNGVL